MRANSTAPRVAVRVASALLAVSLLAVPANAAERSETVITYDPAEQEFPEGIAVDDHGNIFTTIVPLGEVRVLTPSGVEATLARFPKGTGFGLVGLTLDRAGDLYVAHDSKDPATHGVYRITRRGRSERLPGSEAINLPNGLVFDRLGNLYVTDTSLGAVWRVPPAGSAEIWVQHPLLEGDGSLGFGFPAGANGVAYHPDGARGVLIVANTDLGRLVRVPISRDGRAGATAVFAEDQQLVSADGVAVDVCGNVYATILFNDALVRVSPDGKRIETIATASDGLDGPTSLAFGTRRRERRSLFVANYALAGPLGGAGPSVVKVAVGVPGTSIGRGRVGGC